MSQNGLITSYDLKFDSFGGVNGRQFYMELHIKLPHGGTYVEFNPRKLPQLLTLLKKQSITELPNTPIIVDDTDFGEQVKWIDNFLGEITDKSFPVNDGEYYGSYLYEMYPDKENFCKNFYDNYKRKTLL